MEQNTVVRKRSEILEKLISRAWSDELFKARLMKEPARAVEEELGIKVPEFIEIKVLEETADTRYVVLPYRPGSDDELLDEQLEAVAGGQTGSISYCQGTTEC